MFTEPKDKTDKVNQESSSDENVAQIKGERTGKSLQNTWTFQEGSEDCASLLNRMGRALFWADVLWQL